jgi:hypothetical protein
MNSVSFASSAIDNEEYFSEHMLRALKNAYFSQPQMSLLVHDLLCICLPLLLQVWKQLTQLCSQTLGTH